jgi:short-subunit dehydrogenase involved in D-alanine esterification of teichoic acids
VNISGNTIFIPGATSGIGLALALRLQAVGNTVIIGGRRSDELQRLAAEHGLATVTLDTTDAGSVTAARDRIVTQYPDLNVLIAMAGISIPEDVPSGGFLDAAERMVATNILGPLRLVAAFIPHLQTRPDATVMTVSSGLAFTPLAYTPTYNGTKAFIHQYSESIRLQLAGTSVNVVELVPPGVRTELMSGQSEIEQFLPVDDFADQVITLIEQNPEATEILVEAVKFLRFSEAEHRYAETVAAVNAHA